MIDFRYHLVSIVAVFLALGVGLLLGTTQLAPRVAERLTTQSRHQHTQILQEQAQINSYQQFVAADAPVLLGHLLTGKHVVLVDAPGADSGVVSGITAAVNAAGGTVTGVVALQQQLFDTTPAGQSQLRQLAQQVAPVGQPPPTGSAIWQAGQVLAGALVTKDGPGQPVAGLTDSESAKVVNGFVDEGYLTLSGTLSGRDPAYASLVVVVAPAKPVNANDDSVVNQWLQILARQFERTGQGTVLAASTAGSAPGSLIDAIRTSGNAAIVSTVDDADTVMGDIVVVQALSEELHHIHGNYGMVSAASAGPSPAPTPSPTPSVTPSSSTAAHHGAAPHPTGKQ